MHYWIWRLGYFQFLHIFIFKCHPLTYSLARYSHDCLSIFCTLSFLSIFFASFHFSQRSVFFGITILLIFTRRIRSEIWGITNENSKIKCGSERDTTEIRLYNPSPALQNQELVWRYTLVYSLLCAASWDSTNDWYLHFIIINRYQSPVFRFHLFPFHCQDEI